MHVPSAIHSSSSAPDSALNTRDGCVECEPYRDDVAVNDDNDGDARLEPSDDDVDEEGTSDVDDDNDD
jgi:hypothetical protein